MSARGISARLDSYDFPANERWPTGIANARSMIEAIEYAERLAGGA